MLRGPGVCGGRGEGRRFADPAPSAPLCPWRGGGAGRVVSGASGGGSELGPHRRECTWADRPWPLASAHSGAAPWSHLWKGATRLRAQRRGDLETPPERSRRRRPLRVAVCSGGGGPALGGGRGRAGGRCPPAHSFQGCTAWLPQFGWRLQPGLCPGLCLQAAQLCQRRLICAGCWQKPCE